jgi:hypothetical protein
LGRQRNDDDRLGRLGRQWRAKHGRQILRRWTESDTHANAFSDSNRNSYTDGDCNCDSNAYGYSELHAHAEVCADSETSPDAGTSTVVRRDIKTMIGGSRNNATLYRKWAWFPG